MIISASSMLPEAPYYVATGHELRDTVHFADPTQRAQLSGNQAAAEQQVILLYQQYYPNLLPALCQHLQHIHNFQQAQQAQQQPTLFNGPGPTHNTLPKRGPQDEFTSSTLLTPVLLQQQLVNHDGQQNHPQPLPPTARRPPGRLPMTRTTAHPPRQRPYQSSKFSEEQIERLESRYQETPKVTGAEKHQLAKDLEMTTEQVCSWFCRRRMMERHGRY